MNRYRNMIFNFLCMGILFGLLVQFNASSPRADAEHISESVLPTDQLILLEGGTIGKNAYGGESRWFTLVWKGDGCLFMPKANSHLLLVNGVEWDTLRDEKLRLFQFAQAPAPDGVYEVELRSAGKTLDQYGSCIYLGPLSAVSACVSNQIVSRYVVTGICFCVLLFSGVLYAWKKSETYLFWLALYAFLMMLRTQDALGIGLLVGTESAIFYALDHFVTTSILFRLLYQVTSAALNYQVLKRFLSARIFGRSIMVYITAAAVLETLGSLWLGRRLFLELGYYCVLYVCQIVCIQKDAALHKFEQRILSVAWIFTVLLQIFYTLSWFGVIPNGDAGLQFHIPPVISCIYIIAFFVVACRRFAFKFQEAEYLNAHLEAVVEEKTQEQSAFIRSMLHNLKTPLFSLSGYADMAAENMERPAEAVRCLAKVSDKAQYVSELLDHLFLLTQMDANQVVYQCVPVPLCELLDSVAENARLKGKKKDIRVSLFAAQDAFCMGDPLYLQQGFQNIADNAVEHINFAGKLEITVSSRENQWEITFSDDGCGISPNDLSRIFERYYSNHHGKRNSSGLGLTITKEIIEHHGGTITAQSQQEKGAVFTVMLPKSLDTL